METEAVDPSQIKSGDWIALWTTDTNNDSAPAHFEKHQIQSVEEPNKTHPDAYDFEYFVENVSPTRYGAGVRWPRSLPVDRVLVVGTPIFMERG